MIDSKTRAKLHEKLDKMLDSEKHMLVFSTHEGNSISQTVLVENLNGMDIALSMYAVSREIKKEVANVEEKRENR